MQSSNSQCHRTATVVATVLLGLFALACDGGGPESRSPTAPPSLAPPAPTGLWSGSWTFDEAGPAGDCLAQALNDGRARGGLVDWRVNLDFETENGGARLKFTFPGDGDSEGFWPIEFTGTIDSKGNLFAKVPAERLGDERTDPWLELCYWSWSVQGGDLSAVLSPNGRTLTGGVVETFRVENPPLKTTFTIRSHFTATLE
jgi:hypothetical protein